MLIILIIFLETMNSISIGTSLTSTIPVQVSNDFVQVASKINHQYGIQPQNIKNVAKQLMEIYYPLCRLEQLRCVWISENLKGKYMCMYVHFNVQILEMTNAKFVFWCVLKNIKIYLLLYEFVKYQYFTPENKKISQYIMNSVNLISFRKLGGVNYLTLP